MLDRLPSLAHVVGFWITPAVVDAVALWAITARISEFGFTPNRVAALGMNVILLVTLAWSAVVYIRFLRGAGQSQLSSAGRRTIWWSTPRGRRSS
jgi:hypothetical protein